MQNQQALTSKESLGENDIKRKREEDQSTIKQQQERIQWLMEENNSFLLSIATLKAELKEARHQFDELSKIVKMLTNGTQRLDDMQSQGKRCDEKKRLGLLESGFLRNHGKTIFVYASCSTLDQVDIVKGKTTENNVSPVKIADRRKKWSCYFCGRFGHIRSLYYLLQNLQPKEQTHSSR